MDEARVLLVDDDEVIRLGLGMLLQSQNFQVTTAANVSEALSEMVNQTFDVLLSDLNMPGAGDGLTVVSAMRHSNPMAVTILLSAHPRMEAAAEAIVLQADEVLVKPMAPSELVDVIRQRLAAKAMPAAPQARITETVAAVLEATSHCRRWRSRPGSLRCFSTCLRPQRFFRGSVYCHAAREQDEPCRQPIFYRKDLTGSRYAHGSC